MAPMKPRFSLKSYAGKKKSKISLNFIEEDPFDLLLKDSLKNSNVFESSSEPSCSSRIEGRQSIEPANCSKNNSSVQLSFSNLKSVKGSRSIKKKKNKYPKSKVNGVLKSFNNVHSHDHATISSTPYKIPHFRNITKGTNFKAISESLRITPDVSPICKPNELQDTGQSLNENPPSSTPPNCGLDVKSSSKKSWPLSRCRKKAWNVPLDDENSECDDLNISGERLNRLICSDVSPCGDKPVFNNLADSSSPRLPLKLSFELNGKSLEHNSDCNIRTKTSDKSLNEGNNNKSTPFRISDINSSDLPSSLLEDSSDSSNVIVLKAFGCTYKHRLTKSSSVTVRKKRESVLSNRSDLEEPGSIDTNLPSFSNDSYDNTPSKHSPLSETFDLSHDSTNAEISQGNQEELRMMASSLTKSHLNFTQYNSPLFFSNAERVQRSKHSYDSLPVQPCDGSMKKTDIDRRRIYQRLSRSLPASFKDSTPLFGERGGVIDIDLRRSRKTFARMKDDPSSCSTRSLPAVLEDQDLESSTDEEFQTPRGSLHFRKSSFDQSVNSPLFLGFSSAEKVKKRSFIFKKHSDSKIIGCSTIINSNVSCTSPHKLPVVQEDDSDSSCDSGDDSKRLESESSSQLESPLLSPSVQGSPSRRENSRLSASNSSETSLSSRSEGITSPLQDDIINTPPRSSSPEFAAASSEEDSGSSPIRREEQTRRRRPSRLTSKRTLGYIAEESESDMSELASLSISNNKRFVLVPGKKYRRSLAIIHNHIIGEEPITFENKGRNYSEMVETVKLLQKEESTHLDSDDSSDMSPDSRRLVNRTSLSKLASRFSTTVYSDELSDTSPDSVKSANFKTIYRQTNRFSTTLFSVNSDILDVTVALNRLSLVPVESSCLSTSIHDNELFTSEAAILQLSEQTSLLEFSELFSDGSLHSWKKIGEGVYSEVFSLTRSNKSSSVLKIIPVDGEIIVNGGTQMSLDDNLSEVLVSKFLSDLRDNEESQSEGFVQLLKVWYIEGCYPDPLIQLWNEFNTASGSDNDCPVIFPSDQKYLCLELENSGKALESYTFSSARQSLSVFKQIAFSLAVAETSLEFEHRDLHWGNILVDKTKEKTADFTINSEKFRVVTNGLKATIIDYTWSSLTYSVNNFRIANDMEQDPDLFLGKGDLQFDIYRLMREDVERDWMKFRPKTNVRWLYYLADKLLSKSKYQRPSTNAHKEGIAALQNILDFIQDCNSSLQVAMKLHEIN